MKYSITSSIILLLIAFPGCERMEIGLDSLVGSRWALSEIVDRNENEKNVYPGELEPFEISFHRLGIMELEGLCNFHYGEYILEDHSTIEIFEIGPGTKMCCLPDLLMEWEQLFIEKLKKSESYSIKRNQLIIKCKDSEDLVFDFQQSPSNSTGQILFCTNSLIINCPYRIEISLGGVCIDTITARSVFSEENCACSPDFRSGVVIEMDMGLFEFSARELECVAENKVNFWSGEVEVKENKCSTVELSVLPL
jgi:heat shock protein HslJ